MQRKLERAIRKQKNRVLVDEATGDKEKLLTDQIKLQRYRQEYSRFSKAAGLRTEDERLFVSGFGRKQAANPATKPKSPVVEKPITGAPTKPAATPPSPTRLDVLDEYVRTATPGVGSITFEEGYKQGKHATEIKTAQWLHDVFGGDIVLLNESGEQGQKMPDYLWRGKLWDLKNPSTVNAADDRLRSGLKQILSNPGGIILDYGDNLVSIEDVVKKADDRVSRGGVPNVDVMIMSKGNVVKILRYKK